MADAGRFDFNVFISYSDKDQAWVRDELLKRIEAAGVKAFIDFRDFEGGVKSIQECDRGVKKCRKMLAVLTPDYLKSEWCEYELSVIQMLTPANRERRLIPLLKRPCDRPTWIAMLTHIDFTDGADHDLAWRQLLTALGKPPVSTPAVLERPRSTRLLRRQTMWAAGVGLILAVGLFAMHFFIPPPPPPLPAPVPPSVTAPLPPEIEILRVTFDSDWQQMEVTNHGKTPAFLTLFKVQVKDSPRTNTIEQKVTHLEVGQKKVEVLKKEGDRAEAFKARIKRDDGRCVRIVPNQKVLALLEEHGFPREQRDQIDMMMAFSSDPDEQKSPAPLEAVATVEGVAIPGAPEKELATKPCFAWLDVRGDRDGYVRPIMGYKDNKYVLGDLMPGDMAQQEQGREKTRHYLGITGDTVGVVPNEPGKVPSVGTHWKLIDDPKIIGATSGGVRFMSTFNATRDRYLHVERQPPKNASVSLSLDQNWATSWEIEEEGDCVRVRNLRVTFKGDPRWLYWAGHGEVALVTSEVAGTLWKVEQIQGGKIRLRWMNDGCRD